MTQQISTFRYFNTIHCLKKPENHKLFELVPEKRQSNSNEENSEKGYVIPNFGELFEVKYKNCQI